MALPNIFERKNSEILISRIESLNSNTVPKWGKMDVAQMLAHCNVMYEMVFEKLHPEPNFFMKFVLKTFVKKIVTSEAPYKHNSQTAPIFIIKSSKNFESEKKRLINYIQKVQELGELHFDNKASHSFGNLTIIEWNNMFYKHLDHHLNQFGT
ncbi:DUF1569 domain-containing protein [Flavobacterium algicola]|uniref:DUF1569 domain-containing protein n=1 Tax=Flavobacterium algicola TaxID=556529 RepID=UPI001EFC51CB|nr:DUF1569 domain-containing protein [Flavobacterium algicola]MCG9792438.1 DUF1569 domain-containing protein [Flavobacterium algicola]